MAPSSTRMDASSRSSSSSCDGIVFINIRFLPVLTALPQGIMDWTKSAQRVPAMMAVTNCTTSLFYLNGQILKIDSSGTDMRI